MHRLGKLTSDSTERKKYLQLKIGSYSFGKQNFKHLMQQLDFTKSKVYCLSGVKKKEAQLASYRFSSHSSRWWLT